MYIEKRARPDTEIQKKIKRMIQYSKQKIDDVRIIGCKDLKSVYTWVDAAYGVWLNMRSRTRGCMSTGLGIIHCKLSKQKFNTKSSTGSEIVGLSDCLPCNLWFRNFMKKQGYEIDKNVVYQYNQ